MKTNWKTIALGAGGVVAAGAGYYLWRGHKNSTTTVAALDPQGGPYLGLSGGVFQKVFIGMSDGSKTLYSFPLESLPNLAQVKGQNLTVAGRSIAALKGVADPGFPTLPGA